MRSAHGNYVTLDVPRDALTYPDDGPASGKGPFNLAPRTFIPHEWTTSGQKRVKGPLSISTISSASLTFARKPDDVSNYPTQKPPSLAELTTPTGRPPLVPLAVGSA